MRAIYKRFLSNRLEALGVLLAAITLACAGGAEEGVQHDEDNGKDPATAPVAREANVSCAMSFTMEGWSAIVSMAEGRGVITCDNGQTAEVDLRVTGGGLTAGMTEIDDGSGDFSDVRDISELFGDYAQVQASAGVAEEAASAQALTKGDVSLVISAEGRGWSLDVSGAKFTIAEAGSGMVPPDEEKAKQKPEDATDKHRIGRSSGS